MSKNRSIVQIQPLNGMELIQFEHGILLAYLNHLSIQI